MTPDETGASMLRKVWMKLMLRHVHYADNYKQLDAFYSVSDPWRMVSPREQYRFEETNMRILEMFGRVGSLLEIGCGEGHQSLQLQEVCNRLTGLDVSATAVARAKCRCVQGEFLAADIFSGEIDARAPFDLVVACEVLYYIKDVPAVLQRMRVLGRNILVTYSAKEMDTLDSIVMSFPGVAFEVLEFRNARWRVAWWRSDQF